MPAAYIQKSPPAKTQKRVDVEKALKLRLQGNTFAEIGAVLGVSPQAVEQRLDAFREFLKSAEPGVLAAFTDQRAQLLNAMELRMMQSLLDEDVIAKASLNNRAYAFQQIHQARRLEEGKSTENMGFLGKLVVQSEGELGAVSQPKADPQAVVVRPDQSKVSDPTP